MAAGEEAIPATGATLGRGGTAGNTVDAGRLPGTTAGEEPGIEDALISSWIGLFAPAGTPTLIERIDLVGGPQ